MLLSHETCCCESGLWQTCCCFDQPQSSSSFEAKPNVDFFYDSLNQAKFHIHLSPSLPLVDHGEGPTRNGGGIRMSCQCHGVSVPQSVSRTGVDRQVNGVAPERKCQRSYTREGARGADECCVTVCFSSSVQPAWANFS